MLEAADGIAALKPCKVGSDDLTNIIKESRILNVDRIFEPCNDMKRLIARLNFWIFCKNLEDVWAVCVDNLTSVVLA